MSSVGRKSKLTPERFDKIVNLIQAGNFSSTAAAAAGISERTYYRWIKEGEEAAPKCEEWDEVVGIWNELTDKEKRKHPEKRPNENTIPTEHEYKMWEFYEAIKKAEADAEASTVLHIRKAATEGTWQAAAWLLERGRAKERWSKQDKVQHEGTVQHRLGIGASEEEIEAAKKQLQEARKQLPETTEEIIEAEAEEG